MVLPLLLVIALGILGVACIPSRALTQPEVAPAPAGQTATDSAADVAAVAIPTRPSGTEAALSPTATIAWPPTVTNPIPSPTQVVEPEPTATPAEVVARPPPPQPTRVLAGGRTVRSPTPTPAVRTPAVLVLGLDRAGNVINFGTGIPVSADGLILTSQRTVQGAAQLAVRATDEVAGPAYLVLDDPARNLAIVRSDLGAIAPVQLGSVESLRSGDTIAVRGFPGAEAAETTIEGRWAEGRGWADGQTGAAAGEVPVVAPANPGFSGAPVLNAAGDVVAILTRPPLPGQSSAVGSALPIDQARDLIARARGGVFAPLPGGTFAGPAGAVAEIIDRVDGYYHDLNSGNAAAGYEILSESARRTQSVGSYLAQFRSLVSIENGPPAVVSLGGNRAVVQLQTATVSRVSGRLYRQNWQITWHLVRERGQWRRDGLDQRALSEPTLVEETRP